MDKTKYILILLLLFLTETFSQQSDRMQLFSIEEGLSLSAITCVYQDSEGYLWIGTQDGLNRYDGYNFEIFRRQPLDSSSLTDNFIRAIAEDTLGDLWIGTSYGLSKFIRQEGRFENYYHNIGQDNALHDNTIHDIYVSRAGEVWIKTATMLEKYNRATNDFVHYRLFNDPNTVPQGINVTSIIENDEGLLWIGNEDGLNLFDPKNNEIIHYTHDPNDKSTLSDNRITSLIYDQERQLWISTLNGLNKFDPETNTFERFYPSEMKGSEVEDRINFVFQDSNGTFWIGTERGMTNFDPENGNAGKIIKFQFNNRNLNNAFFSDIIEDRSHILWITTYRGMIKLDLKEPKFTIYDNAPTSIPQLSSNVIASIYCDKQDNLWLGTWGEGLNIYNRKTKEHRLYSESHRNPSQRISQNNVHLIFTDENGELFIGTNDGIDRYNPRTKRFRSICNMHGFIPCKAFENNRIFDMIQVDEDYYIGSFKGLMRVNFNERKFEKYSSFSFGDSVIMFNTVYALLFDSSRRVWLGTDNGLIQLNDRLKVNRHFQGGMNSASGDLTSNVIYHLFEDSQKRIWIGTSLGLCQFLEINESFLLFTEEKGLPNNLIYAIQEDNNGNLWLSTNRGLSNLIPSEKKFINYEISDGLQSFEFNLGAHFKKSDGELFFGGISGVNAFYPDSFQVNQVKPSVVISKIEKVDDHGNKTALETYGLNELNISYPNYLLNIEFAALDFTYPDKNRYRYSLIKEGGEENVVDLGTHRYVSLLDLQPGRYTLKFMGSNSDQVWNTEGGSLIINVEVPWWRSSNAILIYAIVLLLAFVSFYFYRTRTLRRLNQEYRERERINNQIAIQREELALKNKNITDSLNYAKRIQEAMMPSKNLFDKFLPESFILHMPKDIVSGDFYWINEHEDKIYVAAIDCTGHGVPGAFMSIIGFELFRRITNIQNVEEPAQILNIVNNNFAEVFEDVEEFSLRDGMDIAFCVIDKKKMVLEYSGAFNPLYLIRDNKLSEIKGDRFSVGIDMHLTKKQAFRNHSINLEEGDVVYIFSDGFADQFGGPEGKKYKYRRFRHLLLTIHKLPMKMQHDLLKKSILEWKGDLDQVDDILVIGFKP
jgi:ligand-binding sensor domain-containing protein/serine phosphatase RsbU (regulator of sigma subunit)